MKFEKLDNLTKKLKKIKTEALRKPTAKNVLTYGTPEFIEASMMRTFKTIVVPRLNDLIHEIEICYNSCSSSSHNDSDGAKKQEKQLKPLENIHDILKKAEKEAIRYMAGKNLNEENDIGAFGYGDGGKNPIAVGDKTNDFDPNDTPKGDQSQNIVPRNETADNLVEIIGALANMQDIKPFMADIDERELKNAIDTLQKIRNAAGRTEKTSKIFK